MGGVECMTCDLRACAAIEIVTEKRMAQMSEVDANLMRASCVELQAQEAVSAVRLHRHVMGACGLSFCTDTA